VEAIDKVLASGTPSKYDLVLMDLQMPIMGGLKATAEIRTHEAFNKLPIIAMTADAIIGVKEKCLESGMMDFITKPIHPVQMLNTLEKWLKPKGDPLDISIVPLQSTKEMRTIFLLEGIDQAKGVYHLGGNAILYQDLLVQFLKNHENYLIDLRDTFNKGDEAEGRMMVHTLKGISGNLGMVDLHEKCTKVENLFQNEDVANADEIMQILGPEMEKVLGALKNLLPQAFTTIGRQREN
jgi:CheY-like chemotaxis protein/HPt (histidine-containing phosphotransfer) domain-containing protein